MTKARTLESRGNVFTPFTGCAQIYHQRWYVRPSGTPAEGIVCLATANRGSYTSPTAQKARLPLSELCVQTKAKVRRGFYLPTKSIHAPHYSIGRI